MGVWLPRRDSKLTGTTCMPASVHSLNLHSTATGCDVHEVRISYLRLQMVNQSMIVSSKGHLLIATVLVLLGGQEPASVMERGEF